MAHRDAAGAFEMSCRPYLVLSAAMRASQLRAHVLLAADPHHDVLVVHPLAALDTMITAYHASLTTVGNGDTNGEMATEVATEVATRDGSGDDDESDLPALCRDET